MLKRIARYVLTSWLWDYSSAEIGLGHVSWSQFGEDILVRGLFPNQKTGFYVDVGAFHPLYLSNTYALYRLGWRGLAIDPNRSILSLFAKARPKDRVIHSAVGAEGLVNMTMFAHGAFNCAEDQVIHVPEQFRTGAKRVVVQSDRLATILERESVGKIDFLNIDCEGADLLILESNDWLVWVPRVICVEDHSEDWQSSQVALFLIEKGYRLAHRAGLSTIFQKEGK